MAHPVHRALFTLPSGVEDFGWARAAAARTKRKTPGSEDPGVSVTRSKLGNVRSAGAFSPTPAEQAIASATGNPIGLAANIGRKQPCSCIFFPELSLRTYVASNALIEDYANRQAMSSAWSMI
jgi:hypothetical protein